MHNTENCVILEVGQINSPTEQGTRKHICLYLVFIRKGKDSINVIRMTEKEKTKRNFARVFQKYGDFIPWAPFYLILFYASWELYKLIIKGSQSVLV